MVTISDIPRGSKGFDYCVLILRKSFWMLEMLEMRASVFSRHFQRVFCRFLGECPKLFGHHQKAGAKRSHLAFRVRKKQKTFSGFAISCSPGQCRYQGLPGDIRFSLSSFGVHFQDGWPGSTFEWSACFTNPKAAKRSKRSVEDDKGVSKVALTVTPRLEECLWSRGCRRYSDRV